MAGASRRWGRPYNAAGATRAEAVMTEGYVDSYYARTIAEDRPRPALDGPMETEVCVIGGGMAGLATALGLADAARVPLALGRPHPIHPP